MIAIDLRVRSRSTLRNILEISQKRLLDEDEDIFLSPRASEADVETMI